MSKFKILWIDDEISDGKVYTEIENVKNSLLNKGYTPDITEINTIDLSDIKEDAKIGAKLKARIYDIVFLDFKLKNRVLGSDIISEMRKNNNMFCDIILYSSDGDNLKKSVIDSYTKAMLEYIDDVHIAILDDSDWDEKIDKAISKVISSWFKPSAFRGIVLDKTCKFEKNVMKLLISNFRALKLEVCKSNISTCLPQTKQLKGTYLQTFNNISTLNDLLTFINENSHIFNWSFKFKLLTSYVKNNFLMNIYNSILIDLDYVFNVRNDISHNEIEIINACLVVHLKNCDDTYNETKVKDIVDKINKIDNTFEKYLS